MLEFIQELTNHEKTRNQNLFKNYTLDTFESILKVFGLEEPDPNHLRISVVGTNGKGSTSYFLSKAFRRLGDTGLYTSPHFESIWERIQINHTHIQETWIEEWILQNKENLELLKKLSFFEFLTLLCFDYFKQKNAITQVYEAGLGGRLDSTKLAKSQILVICKIGLDHKEILGDTKEKILIEKLNIITKYTEKIFYLDQNSNLNEIIQEFANQNSIKSFCFNDFINESYLEVNKKFAEFIFNSLTNQKIILNKNDYPIGRLEIISESPFVIYDLAHNPEAVFYTLNSLEKLYKDKKWTIIFACLKDKDKEEMLKILSMNSATKIIFQIIGESWNSDKFENTKIVNIEESDLKKILTENSDILVLGSTRLYGKIKSCL
jgi:dihydrofolate synthase/folylpolyglutamate synthase